MVAAHTGLPSLTFDDPTRGRQTVNLTGDRVAPIGRRPESDVALPWDPNVSRVHAELQPVGGEWGIVDDGLSYDGTDANGQRLTGRRRPRHGDVIAVGLTYRSPPGSAGSTTT